MQHKLLIQNSCNTMYKNKDCFRYIIVNNLHKGDKKDNNNNNNNNKELALKSIIHHKTVGLMMFGSLHFQ